MLMDRTIKATAEKTLYIYKCKKCGNVKELTFNEGSRIWCNRCDKLLQEIEKKANYEMKRDW